MYMDIAVFRHELRRRSLQFGLDFLRRLLLRNVQNNTGLSRTFRGEVEQQAEAGGKT